MARLSSLQLQIALNRARWTLLIFGNRFYRQHRLSGVLVLIGILAILFLSAHVWRAQHRLELSRQALANAAAQTQTPLVEVGQLGKLQAFDAYLAAYEDAPDVVQGMFRLAQAEGLALQRGEYKRDLDTHGQFMRYRMSLPIKGDAQSIYRFVIAALQTHPSLALESVQFKRTRVDAKDLEVSVQWVLLTRLPTNQADNHKAIVISSVDVQ